MTDSDIKKAFDDWKNEAASVDILEEARARGARLKRTGTEWVGPCPTCGGRDRLGVNPIKKVFVCRGAAGGDVIALASHLGGVDFLGACEQLTGRPPPRGRSKPLTAEQQAEAERKRAARDREAAARDRVEAQRVARKAATAAEIWASCVPIAGTLAETYLVARGIAVPPMGWPTCLGFAKSLLYELDPALGSHPCLVARVDDVGEAITAVWRIFLSADGLAKAKLSGSSKLGLGPAGGGAVRIGGTGAKIGAAEGIETALASWQIENYRFPVWATLGTSGMTGLDLPLCVERLSIYADADLPRRNRDGDMEEKDWTPPGLRAALKLRDKVTAFGVKAVIQELPFVPGRDFADVLKSCVAAENAA